MGHVFGDEFGNKSARFQQHSSHFSNAVLPIHHEGFPRQSHLDGMCEFMTEELVDPPLILLVSYAEYLANGFM